VIPIIFQPIISFSDSFEYTKVQKKNLHVGGFSYFAFTIHMGSNFRIITGVRDLDVAFLRLILPKLMTYVVKIYCIYVLK